MRSFRQNRDRLEARAREEVEAVRKGMHRRPLGGGGQWEETLGELNPHQKVAAATRGWLTAANVVSVAGAGLTAYGMHQAFNKGNFKRGTLFMGLGRIGDLIDGGIAAKTETCSDKGAAIDAGLDKILSGAFLFIGAKSGRLPVAEAVSHAAQQVMIFRESYLIKNAGGDPNPGKYGKYGMGALWLRAGGVVAAPTAEEFGYHTTSRALSTASHVASLTALYLNQQAYETYHAERLALQSVASASPAEVVLFTQ